MSAAQHVQRDGVTANGIMPRARTRMNDSGPLAAMCDIADTWLDWNRLGPIVELYRALIQPDVE